MKNIPIRIYMQIGDDDVTAEDFDSLRIGGDITWSDDKISESDIEYVKVALVKKLYEYIELLGSEIKDSASFLHVHGWESERIDLGKKLRKEIKELEK